MPHKAGTDFFAVKRPWSERKDRILHDYLTPYLAKIGSSGTPVLIVDGFAGPGKFGDGKPGSPLIICDVVNERLGKGLRSTVRVICVEDDPILHSRLTTEMSRFSFASVRPGKFVDSIDEIEKMAATNNIFLYVDPYTVEGLNWAEMDRIFQHIRKSRSIEILLNFNASSFMRRGLGLLAIANNTAGKEDDSEFLMPSTPSVEKLNEVVGGAWWQEILKKKTVCGPGK